MVYVITEHFREPESAMGCHHVPKTKRRKEKEGINKYKIGFVPLVTHKSSYT